MPDGTDAAVAQEEQGMSDKGSSDNIARITAIASLCIAVVAIVVPYVQQRSQFNALQAEELNLRVSPEIDGPVRLLAHDFGSLGRVVQVPWELTLSNTRNRKLSIVQYDVSMGTVPRSSILQRHRWRYDGSRR